MDIVDDLENCKAFINLDHLLKDNKISKIQYEHYRCMYTKLHEVMMSTYCNEANLLSRAKLLNETYLKKKSDMENKMVNLNKLEESVRHLRKDLEMCTDELKEVKDESQLVQFELEELEQSNDEKERSIEDRREANLARIQPLIDELKKKKHEINEEIETNKHAYEKETKLTIEYREQMKPLAISCRTLEKEKHQLRSTLDKMRGDPDAMRAKVSLLEKAKNRLDIEINKVNDETQLKDEELSNIQEERHALDDERYNMEYKLEMLRTAIAKAQSEVDERKRILEEESEARTVCEEEIRRIEWQKSQTKRSYREEQYSLGAHHKTVERLKRKYEKLRRKGDTVYGILQPLKQQYERLDGEKLSLQRDLRTKSNALKTFKEDEELFISQLLKQEQFEEDTLLMLDEIKQEAQTLENKIDNVMNEERNMKQNISELEASRAYTARLASQATQLARETRDQLKIRDLVMLDLEKQRNQTKDMLQNCSQLYKVVRTQRNKFANTSQSVTQAIAEMREKIKILTNEVTILREEVISRDAALREERRQHQSSKTVRDGLRVENNKSINEIRELKDDDERQLMEIEKLNSMITRTEQEMITLRKKYARIVETHNSTGIQLIDRNDELSILYEKSTIHDNILKKGKKSLSELMDRIRLLKLQIDELQRQSDSYQRRLPSPYDYSQAREKLEKLEKELKEEQKIAEHLALKLEVPTKSLEKAQELNDNELDIFVNNLEQLNTRQRQLDGIDPNEDQMEAKLKILNDRLNRKKEQLLEKELVLDEVTSLTTKLSLQAATNRQSGLELAKQINDYQSKIRSTTRKMMAVVSELSMYQAKSMKLEEDKNELSQNLEEATQRLRNGLPPTDEAEHEYVQMQSNRMNRERYLMNSRKNRNKNHQQQNMDRMIPYQEIKTKAQTRPNAYIPDNIGIPRPYIIPPFKPTPLGANIRHIRKPQPREIEL